MIRTRAVFAGGRAGPPVRRGEPGHPTVWHTSCHDQPSSLSEPRTCAPGGSPHLILLAACSDDNSNGPGITPEAPASLSSTSLDGAIALVWSDNPFQADPDIFGNYRVYSTSYDIDADAVRLRLVARGHHGGARVPGRRARQRRAALLLGDGRERGRIRERPVAAARRHAAPRLAQRRALRGRPATPNGSRVPLLGRSERRRRRAVRRAGTGAKRQRSRTSTSSWTATSNGDLFLTPVRAGNRRRVLRRERSGRGPHQHRLRARTWSIAPRRSRPLPGFGYVFETDGGDGFVRYGAVRVLHVGTTFLILDWAFQTDPGNPELIVRGVPAVVADDVIPSAARDLLRELEACGAGPSLRSG